MNIKQISLLTHAFLIANCDSHAQDAGWLGFCVRGKQRPH